MTEWPKTVTYMHGRSRSTPPGTFGDHDKLEGRDALVRPLGGYAGFGHCWCEPVDERMTGFAEFTITTDTTEAPADALLEGAGYEVREAACGMERRPDGAWATATWRNGCRLALCISGPWTGSWDMDLADYAKPETFAKPAPCTQCNDTGLVDGFLGVGIQIPCGLCGGR